MVDDVDTTKQSPIIRPVVTLSYAQTLDGRLATSTGNSQWISAPESLRSSHELRAKHDAIMFGVGIEAVGDLGVRELARALLITDMSVTRYGVDLVLNSRIEYPGTPPMTVGSEERVGCDTA